jgi:serine/threonine protein kinase
METQSLSQINQDVHGLSSIWPAQLLAKYDPLQVLGYGGRSVVVEARKCTGEIVAIKIPYSRRIDVSQKVLKKILAHEGEVLASITHQGVVRLIEREDNGEYLIIERLSGDSLFFKYSSDRPTISAGLQYAAILAGALHAVHASGYLHLDFKPHNVLFHNVAAKCPVLVDFGSARPTAKPVGPGTIDINKLGTGKYKFKAPEQLMYMEKVYGPQTDGFGLGVTLYWLLCGSMPFSNSCASQDRALEIYLKEYRAAVKTCRAMRLPSIAKRLVEKLISIDMGERPCNMGKVAKGLRRSALFAQAL